MINIFLKIVYNSIVIDVVQNPRWVRWIERVTRFVETDIDTANGIVQRGGVVYHIEGTPTFAGNDNEYKTVIPVEITEHEFHFLKSQIVDKAISSSGDEVSLGELIENKINEMSQCCEGEITKGFDIVLSDGVSHHFSLQIHDQIKISKLNDRAMAGESFLPYHADNEPCKIYSADDIRAINSAMEYIVEYQTTYFNSLKMYISGMTSKDDIINVTYGTEIPDGYRSEVLSMMIAASVGEQ